MIWTITMHKDGSFRNAHPGHKYGYSRKFTVEAPNLVEAEKQGRAKIAETMKTRPQFSAAVESKPVHRPMTELALSKEQEQFLARFNQTLSVLEHQLMLQIRRQWLDSPNVQAFGTWVNKRLEETKSSVMMLDHGTLPIDDHLHDHHTKLAAR
jgi:hypothetical protein